MLELKQVKKIYQGNLGKVEALKDISLKIQDGEFIAVMGKSGCGKSTLLNVIGCMDTYDGGEYRIDEKNAGALTRKNRAVLRREKFGFIFQAFYLLPECSVFQNVALPLKYRKTPRKQYRDIVMPLLEGLSIAKLEKRMPHELSGGEQQRVAIARSLVNDPRILLADEPTGNLDSENGEAVLELLVKLRQQLRKTMILVTHDVKIASYADRIVEMRDGRIL